jgi:hypothetical protein
MQKLLEVKMWHLGGCEIYIFVNKVDRVKAWVGHLLLTF